MFQTYCGPWTITVELHEDCHTAGNESCKTEVRLAICADRIAFKAAPPQSLSDGWEPERCPFKCIIGGGLA